MNYSDLPSHHAILCVHPERKAVANTLWDDLRAQSPVHVFFDDTVLDIETARYLISWANTPYNNEEKIALLSFHTITIPAQNALLKVLEEPRTGVRFVLITSTKEAIIPTLYSRLLECVYRETASEKNELKDNALLFLKELPSSRMNLSFIITLLTKTDEGGRKDRESVRAFILNLVDCIKNNNAYDKETLLTLEMASYAGDPSASGKTILEYLALLLPQMKA
jgi:hypothetical protein